MVTAEVASLDPRRVRTFLGLVLGRLGPRAHGAVSGVFLALLVGTKTKSLVAITFALTAHRLVTWLAYPFAGRLSDRTEMSLGRRVPFMAGGLLISGVCTALYINASSYWTLVAVLVISRIALVTYNLPAAAVTPEAFGSSRWLRAGLAVTIGGVLVGLSIRATVIATWNQNDQSTWRPAYYLAAGYIVFAALSILFLVREAPVARKLTRRTSPDVRATINSVLSQPNAKVLIAGLLLAIAEGGAFQRAYPIYARDVLGSGGRPLAVAAIGGAALFAAGIPFALWFAGRVPRKTTALCAGVVASAGAIAHLWVTDLWQSVVLLALSRIFLAAAVIALAALYLHILPREGGLGERLGVMIAPILLASMIASFITALVRDNVVSDYRVIWIPTAIFGLAAGLIYQRLDLPRHSRRADTRRGRKMLLSILWGRRDGRRLFRGELDDREVDGAALLELVADELNPYVQYD